MWIQPSVRHFPLLPEAELLVWCARTEISDEVMARIRQRVEAPLDWEIFQKLAEYHGVEALVSRTLTTVALDLVPAEVLARLRQKASVGALLNRTLAHELSSVCHSLQAHGVPVIPLKGATLAVQAYGELGLRDFTDLDLLVPESAAGEAHAVLARLGYERRSVVAGDEAAHHDGPHHVLVKRRTLCRIDLQWVMAHTHFRFRLDRPEFWARRTTVTLQGQPIPALAPEDLLLVLCVHGSKHAWEHLKWVCDVAEFLRAQRRSLAWDVLFSRASAWRCRRMLELGLALAHRLLDAPLPATVRACLQGDDEIASLAPRMPASLLTERCEGVWEQQAALLYFSLKDTWWERWWFAVLLCRGRNPLVRRPPVWCRQGWALVQLARLLFPLHHALKSILSPRVRGALNRLVTCWG